MRMMRGDTGREKMGVGKTESSGGGWVGWKKPGNERVGNTGLVQRIVGRVNDQGVGVGSSP